MPPVGGDHHARKRLGFFFAPHFSIDHSAGFRSDFVDWAACDLDWHFGISTDVTGSEPRAACGSQLVRLAGIEPTTLGFGGQYSIH